MNSYRLTIIIDAADAATAELLRDEIVGAIEDNAESGEIDASAFVHDLELTNAPNPPASGENDTTADILASAVRVARAQAHHVAQDLKGKP